jgi:hypothetical protein
MDPFIMLLNEAYTRVQDADPGSEFYTAVGLPKGGNGVIAEDVTNWKFVFSGVKNKFDRITYADGSFGPVEGYSFPPPWDVVPHVAAYGA